MKKGCRAKICLIYWPPYILTGIQTYYFTWKLTYITHKYILKYTELSDSSLKDNCCSNTILTDSARHLLE